jgi:hypothetical protein
MRNTSWAESPDVVAKCLGAPRFPVDFPLPWALITPMQPATPPEHFDVLIVGAGLSGIGAGWHLQQKCPGKSYAIL